MPGRAWGSSANNAALWILAVIAVLFFLHTAKSLLIPIALAVLISYALEPAVAYLERHRIPRWAGAALLLLLVVAACAGGAYALRHDARQVVEMLPKAAERARQMVASQLGNVGSLGDITTGGGGSAETSGGTSAMSGSLVQRAAAAVVGFAGHVVVVVFLVFFLLLSGHHVRERLIEISGHDAENRRTMAVIIDNINTQVQRYLVVLLVTAVIVAGATWAVLAWMGVQQAAMWGILAGVFNSIPYFGPAIVSGGLFVVGLVQGGSPAEALQMSGAAILITSLEGWLVTPPLMGKAERMSALAVFLGLLLWTWVWGGWGTILAVPMLVVIKSVADHVDRLKPIGRLMAP